MQRELLEAAADLATHLFVEEREEFRARFDVYRLV
jgi:hypothetical protein